MLNVNNTLLKDIREGNTRLTSKIDTLNSEFNSLK